MTLDQIQPKTTCVITKITARGTLDQRLTALGLYPGLTVHVLRNAPLRDPMEIEVDGTYVSLRHEEARFVEVDLP